MSSENTKWIISTVLAALALVVPIILFIFSTSVKTLDFEIRSKIELTKESNSVENLKISINGKDVEDIFVYGVKISNTGSKPILKEDYEKILSINVSEDSVIYSAKKNRTYPENLSLKFKIDKNQLLISPMLLNPNDEFEINIYSSSGEYPKLDARIAGVSTVNSKSPESRNLFLLIISGILAFILMIFYSKHLRLALPLRRVDHTVSDIFNNTLLGLTCGFSSILLVKDQFGFIDINIVMVFFLPSFIIGYYLAIHQINYNNTMRSF